MAGINHVFVSGKADSADSTLVRPSNWNADHNITGNVEFSGFDITTSGSTFSIIVSDAATPLTAFTLDGTNGHVLTTNTMVQGNNALSINAGGTIQAYLTLASTNASGQGPVLNPFLNRGTPANGDTIGVVEYGGRNSSGAYKAYAQMVAQSVVVTSGVETAALTFNVLNSGANFSALTLNTTLSDGATKGHSFNVGLAANSALQIVSTFAGSGGPYIFISQNASGVANNFVGGIQWEGKDAASNAQEYAEIDVDITSASSGAASGKMLFSCQNTGALRNFLTLNGGNDADGDFNIATFNGSTQSFPSVQIQSSHATNGPSLIFFQNNTGVTNNTPGFIDFVGQNASGTTKTYADIAASINSPTAGSENGVLLLKTIQGGASAARITVGAGVQIGAPTGGDKGSGTINTSNDIFKNGSSYVNPDYVLESWATGKIEKFIDNDGAKEYSGLTPISCLNNVMRETYGLPGIKTFPGSFGAFGRSDFLFEKMEEAYIYISQLHNRVEKLELTGESC